MPNDDYYRNLDDDDLKGDDPKGKVYTEFDCPSCDANNPHDGFHVGSEVMCYYCGLNFRVKAKGSGIALKEI